MGLFDRIWRGWSNFMRGQPDAPDEQTQADADEQANIDRTWPTEEQQAAADDAEQANIDSGSGDDDGDQGTEDGEGEAPEAEPEGEE